MLIPPRVAHGYKVLENKDFLLLYHTDKTYDPKNPDEKRIPFDKYGINLWGVKNR